jgi:hypothetical protein
VITEHKALLNAVCTLFKHLDAASSPTDPAVVQAKRAILNGLAELHMIDALDDASTIAALTALPHVRQGTSDRNEELHRQEESLGQPGFMHS